METLVSLEERSSMETLVSLVSLEEPSRMETMVSLEEFELETSRVAEHGNIGGRTNMETLVYWEELGLEI